MMANRLRSCSHCAPWGSLAALTEGCDEPRELLRRIKKEAAQCARPGLLPAAA